MASSRETDHYLRGDKISSTSMGHEILKFSVSTLSKSNTKGVFIISISASAFQNRHAPLLLDLYGTILSRVHEYQKLLP